jgi:phosphopantetheinyl transferase
MNTVFFAKRDKFSSSSELLSFILRKKFNITEFEIERNENGKPFLKLPSTLNISLFFSVSHTKDAYFIAISNENVGIDAELLNRSVNYMPILSRFSQAEREEIRTTEDFLKLWTIKESVIKWLGGTLAHDLRNLTYEKGFLKYKGLDLPLQITQTIFKEHVLTVCQETETVWNYENIDT